jgi:hypothetical protein
MSEQGKLTNTLMGRDNPSGTIIGQGLFKILMGVFA